MPSELKFRVGIASVLGFLISPFFFFPIALAFGSNFYAPWPALSLAGSVAVVIGSYFYLHDKFESMVGLVIWDICGTVALAFCLFGTAPDMGVPSVIFFGACVYIFSIFQVGIHAMCMLAMYVGPAMIAEEKAE